MYVYRDMILMLCIKHDHKEGKKILPLSALSGKVVTAWIRDALRVKHATV